jgi:hypothetical protein
MTSKQREQVVELLRCGADISNIFSASIALDTPPSLLDLAYDAHDRVERDVYLDVPGEDVYWFACLEAAQRIEEGSCP